MASAIPKRSRRSSTNCSKLGPDSSTERDSTAVSLGCSGGRGCFGRSTLPSWSQEPRRWTHDELRSDAFGASFSVWRHGGRSVAATSSSRNRRPTASCGSLGDRSPKRLAVVSRSRYRRSGGPFRNCRCQRRSTTAAAPLGSSYVPPYQRSSRERSAVEGCGRRLRIELKEGCRYPAESSISAGSSVAPSSGSSSSRTRASK